MTLIRDVQSKGAWRCHEREKHGNEISNAGALKHCPDILSGGAIYIRWDSDEPGPAVQPRSEFGHHRIRRTLSNETLEVFRKQQQCPAKEKRAPENGCDRSIFPTVYVPNPPGVWVLESKDRYEEYKKAIAKDDSGSMDDIMKKVDAEWVENASQYFKLKATQ